MVEPNSEFDKALDEALASYGEAAGIEGLEGRILASVRQRVRRRPVMRLVLAVGASAAACCVVWWHASSIPVGEQAIVHRTGAPRGGLEVPPVRAVAGRDPKMGVAIVSKPRRKSKNLAEPKLALFPTPRPMSDEERALLRLVRGDRGEIPSELTHLGAPIEPIELTELEIKPLE